MLESIIALYSSIPFAVLSLVAFLTIIGSFLDRARGDGWGPPRMLEKVMYGWTIALASGYGLSLYALVIIGLWVLGCSYGWGEPMGAFLDKRPMDQSRLEWYQIGFLKTSTVAALFVRGILWGAPFGIFNIWWALQIAITFVLSLYIVRPFDNSWEKGEYVRGALMVLTTAIIMIKW